MTLTERNQRIEFGDFQTPDELARAVCERLKGCNLRPDVIIEPTCGVGAFLLAAATAFPDVRQVQGYEINPSYLQTVHRRIATRPDRNRFHIEQTDFFTTDWKAKLKEVTGRLLVIGNFPWVTNSGQGVIGGSNLPEKSNFLGHNGFDAISGKANFDISEWMLLDVLRWLRGRHADIAMLVKTSVARKVLAHAERHGDAVHEAFIMNIDAKMNFGASVDASLLVMRLNPAEVPFPDCTVYSSLDTKIGKRIGRRCGMMVGDLDTFESYSFLLGASPQKWRSGIKHDASAVMEFTRTPAGYKNGFGEIVRLEDTYLYPLLKGSDIGSGKGWREKFVLVTQCAVGAATKEIRYNAPLTWAYLESHVTQLNARGSTIYAKNPRFSIFGVGDYAFRPWRIAICSLYKVLRFRLVAPMDGRPIMFDDTVYYLSFATEFEAQATLARLDSKPVIGLLSSLIFWDEKRPIKTSILNALDWSKLETKEGHPALHTADLLFHKW